MFPDWADEQDAFQFGPGDLVLAYTNGVIEVTNPAGEEWGAEGLRRAAVEGDAKCADHIIVQAIFSSMEEFLARTPDR
jgi:serine phosphatase RsbU (regulator of sigma subunit)